MQMQIFSKSWNFHAVMKILKTQGVATEKKPFANSGFRWILDMSFFTRFYLNWH